MSARRLSGEHGGNVLIATDGLRTEVVDDGLIPEWATLYWYLETDPRARADWGSLLGYRNPPPNKLSKSQDT